MPHDRERSQDVGWSRKRAGAGHTLNKSRLEDAARELRQIKEQLEVADAPVAREELGALLGAMEDLLARIAGEQQNLDRTLEALAGSQQELDLRVAAIENSRPFRYARGVSKLAAEWKARIGQLLLHSPFHSTYLKLFERNPIDKHYRRWLEHQQQVEHEASDVRRRTEEFSFRPVVSVLIPTHNPKREWLDAAIASVENQTYPVWELSLCDDASSESWVREYLEQRAAADPRIRFTMLGEHGGISTALNRAGSVSRGDYVTFLDQDDVLSADALFEVAEVLQGGPADLIYSDEDRLSPEGERVEPIFKPGWSPDLLASCMYMGHLFVASRQAIERAGWFRSAYDGSQDHDLALRITDQAPVVRHVPRILYHWRKHAGSTSARASAKPYTQIAGRMALEDAARRRHWDAAVVEGPLPNTYRLLRKLAPEPLASIIIVSRTRKLLERCIKGIDQTTTYQNRELVVVQHKTGSDEQMDALIESYRSKRVLHTGEFDFAVMNNRGAAEADGDILVFMNDDVIPLAPEWLSALVAQAARPEVGVAGARLAYPSGTIQHAGIVVGIMDGCGHPLRGAFAGKYWNWAHVARNVSAVTAACMAVRKEVFEQLGGFDRLFPVNYNDADLCLRARKAGYEVVYEPAAFLRHDECRSRAPGTAHEERMRWKKRWAPELAAGDPYYNPNLTRIREDASLRLEG